ncbi:DUF861 domain-containing protein [Pseudomaricurvus alkylphenolicus]|jgi:uncharacterized cupin superfamily protein|uniref:cupin domain-containing protein n=1 Tax=Pseudomaricurvus alkylphenolicus TaxID=1306991 RepID=UPI00141EE64E|nr:cupin domain-containing protein [Pseudomaricurvus alkylphenolicus]NIB38272.1 DUF861 domain-containing protein [Pseudomaricurvus alkylphenolicus]
MIDYRQATVQQGIEPYLPLEEDGWEVLEGSPIQSMRFDQGSLENGPVLAIWRCTPGKIRKVQPFNEFVTLFDGEVEATVNGESQSLKPGDSYFVPKGATITWDVKKTVSKYLLACGEGAVL